MVERELGGTAGGTAGIRNGPDRRSRALADRRAAALCGACGRALAAGETVWLSRVHTGFSWCQVPTCRACTRGGRWLPPESCEGCGRLVVFRPSPRRWRHAFCSDRCRHRWYHRAREASSALARRKSCIVCARTFTARRRDALTCSPECRQQACRGRTKAAALPRSETATSGAHRRGPDSWTEPDDQRESVQRTPATTVRGLRHQPDPSRERQASPGHGVNSPMTGLPDRARPAVTLLCAASVGQRPILTTILINQPLTRSG
jgi:hypothetical protein